MKALAAALATCLALTAAAAAGRLSAPAYRPPCPHASYGADGNMAPIFCMVDNPLALHYYGRMAKHLFALGPNANPQQVVAAAAADHRTTGTLPILCQSYRLAAWREHWQFALPASEQIGQALHFFHGWCSEPHFNGGN
jgi:hypothetical protein